MITKELPSRELRRRGLRALARELGPVGLIRFLQQYQTGMGDYSRDRRQWLSGIGMKEIADNLKVRRRKKSR